MNGLINAQMQAPLAQGAPVKTGAVPQVAAQANPAARNALAKALGARLKAQPNKAPTLGQMDAQQLANARAQGNQFMARPVTMR